MTIPASVYHKYLKAGWSVFPVSLHRDPLSKVVKKPAVSWKEYQTRFATEDEVAEWDNKYNGIGLATGKLSGVVVIDVDTPDYLPFELTSPIVTQSAFSGGKHYFFSWSEELRNTTRIEDLPVDFRGDGGYVVLPPSSFDEKKYSFVSADRTQPIPPLPQAILAKVKAKPYREVKPVIGNALPGAFEGSRNDTAVRVAGSLIRKIPTHLWEVAAWPALKEWNATLCNPPLDEFELRGTFDSVSTIHTRNNPAEYEIYDGTKAASEHKRLVSEWGTGLSTTFPELDEYFTFMPQHVYLLAAVTHTGKTTVALNLAARMATFHKVLFCSLEMGLFITPTVQQILGGPIPETLSVLTSNKMLSSKMLFEVVESLKVKPEIIFVDHIHFFERSGEKASVEMDRIILELQNLAKELELPVVIIAHTRKLNQDRLPRIDDLRDSSSLAQVPSVIIQLYRRESDEDQLMRGNSYLSQEAMMLIQKNRITGKTGAMIYSLNNDGVMEFGSLEAKVRQALIGKQLYE